MTGTRAQPPAICRQRGFVGVSRWQISTNPHPSPTATCHLPPCLSALVGWGCLTSRHEQSGLHRRRLTVLEARNPNSSLWRLTPRGHPRGSRVPSWAGRGRSPGVFTAPSPACGSGPRPPFPRVSPSRPRAHPAASPHLDFLCEDLSPSSGTSRGAGVGHSSARCPSVIVHLSAYHPPVNHPSSMRHLRSTYLSTVCHLGIRSTTIKR